MMHVIVAANARHNGANFEKSGVLFGHEPPVSLHRSDTDRVGRKRHPPYGGPKCKYFGSAPVVFSN